MSVTIDRLGHHGDGIAAGPIYVPLSLPGDVIEGDIVDGRIEAARVLTPSPDRVRAICPHFKSCGGCALQHASDGFLADWKAGVVVSALAAYRLEAPIRAARTSPPNSRRRGVLSGRRTKKGALVGFHARASGTVIEIPNCKTLHPHILALTPAFQQLTISGASRKAEVSITVTVCQGGVDVSVTGGKPLDLALRQDLTSQMARNGLVRLTWDGETVAQQWPPAQSFAGIDVTPPPGAFLQATKEAETTLIETVAEAVDGARTIADLFAGCGTFALPLARGAQVLAVEFDPDMLASLDHAWRNARGLKKIATQARDLFRRPLLASELRGFDSIVIDPPRAGAEAQSAEIARSEVPRIAYVSCNPATFARDACMLVEAGYEIDWIDVIDQFRWSPHVELVAQLTRRPAL